MESYVPFLTWRFDAALQFASALHHQQNRKGTSIPYLAHLMSVCALVLEAGGEEDQAIAALLHDSVEDHGGSPTLETICHLFGDRVADAVESCSDTTVTDRTKKLPWRERKEKYLEHLRDSNNDAVFVAAADKLHNARAILSGYRELGDELWGRLKAPKIDQLWYYEEFIKAIRQTAAPNTLVDELERVVKELSELAKSSPKASHIVDVTAENLGKAFIVTGQK